MLSFIKIQKIVNSKPQQKSRRTSQFDGFFYASLVLKHQALALSKIALNVALGRITALALAASSKK